MLKSITCDIEFLETDLELTPSLIFEWIPKEKVLANLKDELLNNTKSMYDDIFAHGFKRLCPFKDINADNYKYQVLKLDDHRKIMTSIRFKGLNISNPFVEILHFNFKPNFKEDLEDLQKAILLKYDEFKPKSIRVFCSPEIFTTFDIDVNTSCDFRFVAALISDIKSKPKPLNYEKVSLTSANDLKIYSRYLNLYDQLYRENPNLIHVISTESRESFEKVRNAGTLFNIEINGKWAGIVGVSKKSEKFLHGYEMFDIIISKSFRQKGFTHAIQRRLIDKLESYHHETIFGQINPLNTNVLKTALKIGGKDLGGWYFINLK